MPSQNDSKTLGEEIDLTLAQMKNEVKCPLCMSTWNNPVLTTCMHVFCKRCLDDSFRMSPKCPMCRVVLNRRNCGPSSQHEAIVKAYLQLVKILVRDRIENKKVLPAVHKDIAFQESQAIVNLNDPKSPIKDYRVDANFTVPKELLVKKRRPSRELQALQPPPPKMRKVESPEIVKMNKDKGEKTIEDRDKPGPSTRSSNSPNLAFKAPILPVTSKHSERSPQKLSKLAAPKPTHSSNASGEKAQNKLKEPRENGDEEIRRKEEEMEQEKENKTHLVELKCEQSTSTPLLSSEDRSQLVATSADTTRNERLLTEPLSPASTGDTKFEKPQKETKFYVVTSKITSPYLDNLVHEFTLLFRQPGRRSLVNVQKTFDDHTTHYVALHTNDSGVMNENSADYCMAIAYKCFVIQRQWLEAVVKAGKIVDFKPFIVNKGIYTSGSHMGWVRSKRDKANVGIFSDLNFLVYKNAFQKKIRSELIETLITRLGGKVVKAYHNLEECMIVLGDGTQEVGLAKTFESQNGCNVVVVGAEFILGSVARYDLQEPQPYRVASYSYQNKICRQIITLD